MPGKKLAKLSDKHWKALDLIAKGGKALLDIAKECGWGQAYFYDLYEGNTEKAGSVAALFNAEVRKIDKELVKKIDKLTKSNKKMAGELINRILSDLSAKKKLTSEEKKFVTTLNNSIAKATPNVSIGSLTYNYTKGLTAEELVHEFIRLKTIAGGASQRRAVQTALAGGSGVLPAPDERRGELAQEP